jgi:hypothetical protein
MNDQNDRRWCITGNPEHSRLSLPAPDGEATKVPYGRPTIQNNRIAEPKFRWTGGHLQIP